MEISKKLKKLMEKEGISSYELAKRIDCSEPAIHYWLKGTNIPKVESLKKLAEYFGVPVSYFLE